MEDWNRDQKRWQSGEGGGGGEGAPQTQLNVCFAAEQRWSMCSTWYVYLSRSRLSSSLSQFKCNVCAFCFIECLASSHYTHRQTEDRRRRQRERLWGGKKIRWRQMKPPSIDIVNISPNSRLHSWLKRQTEKQREREEKLAAEHMAGPQFDCQVKKTRRRRRRRRKRRGARCICLIDKFD